MVLGEIELSFRLEKFDVLDLRWRIAPVVKIDFLIGDPDLILLDLLGNDGLADQPFPFLLDKPADVRVIHAATFLHPVGASQLLIEILIGYFVPVDDADEVGCAATGAADIRAPIPS